MKVLFLGSKPIGYKTLEYLLQNQKEFNIKVVGVLSNENKRFNADLSISNLSKTFNVPFIEELDGIFEISDVDFIISVQYHLILRKNHIDHAKKLAINLHMAPLPEYRGCNQFSFAIFNKEKSFGTTLHRLEEGIDSGAIIAEKRFEIPENCFVKDLYDLTFKHSLQLFKEKIKDILQGNYELISQEILKEERGSAIYYRKDIKRLKQIDLNESLEEIDLKVRATAMPGYEPPYTIINGNKYYLIPAHQYQ